MCLGFFESSFLSFYRIYFKCFKCWQYIKVWRNESSSKRDKWEENVKKWKRCFMIFHYNRPFWTHNGFIEVGHDKIQLINVYWMDQVQPRLEAIILWSLKWILETSIASFIWVGNTSNKQWIWFLNKMLGGKADGKKMGRKLHFNIVLHIFLYM